MVNPLSLRGYAPHRLPSLRWTGALALGTLLLTGCGIDQAPTAVEDSYEARLAQHLEDTGSVMYGAYWCPHCSDQKAMFGEASDRIPYIECADDGENAQPQVCTDRGIQAYPTWEIDGELLPGVQPLDDLAELTGFEPPPSN